MAHRKKRQREEQSHHRVKQINRKFRLTKKKRDFIKPEAFIMAYRRSERDERRMNRCIQSEKVFKKPNTKQNILVAYRHRAHKIASDATNKILRRLRLNTLHNTVILKNNIETTALLRLVEPYVTWGYPTVDTVRDLVFKHGFLRIDKKKVPMNCNKLIEENLGELGVICVEDIVHELFTTSKNFNVVQRTLLPFKVSTYAKLHL